jgi:hypothetical protein
MYAMMIPTGAAAVRAWRDVPARIRREAATLSRTGQPHPDPVVQVAVVARQRRILRLTTRLGWLSVALMALSAALVWCGVVTDSPWWLGGGLLAVLCWIQLSAAGNVLMVRNMWLGRLSAPNLTALLPGVAPVAGPLRLRPVIRRLPVLTPTSLGFVLFGVAIGGVAGWLLPRRDEPALSDFETLIVAVIVVLLAVAALIAVLGLAMLWLLRSQLPEITIGATGLRIPFVAQEVPWHAVTAITLAPTVASGEPVATLFTMYGVNFEIAGLPGRQTTMPGYLTWLRRHGEPALRDWVHIAEWQLDQPLEVVVATAIALRERAASGGGRPAAGPTG